MADNERMVWEKMLRGDEKAFSFIYQKYSKELYLYGMKFTSNTAAIEDCIQDLFVSVFNNRNISTTDNIKYYLFRAFRNRLLRMLSRESRYTECSSSEIEFGVTFSIENSIIDSENSEQAHALLDIAIKNLSKRQKEAIYLRFTRGLSYENIAGIMNMEIESCRNTISRAVKSIRNTLKTISSLFLLLCSIL